MGWITTTLFSWVASSRIGSHIVPHIHFNHIDVHALLNSTISWLSWINCTRFAMSSTEWSREWPCDVCLWLCWRNRCIQLLQWLSACWNSFSCLSSYWSMEWNTTRLFTYVNQQYITARWSMYCYKCEHLVKSMNGIQQLDWDSMHTWILTECSIRF